VLPRDLDATYVVLLSLSASPRRDELEDRDRWCNLGTFLVDVVHLIVCDAATYPAAPMPDAGNAIAPFPGEPPRQRRCLFPPLSLTVMLRPAFVSSSFNFAGK
jgi:hypothetical protein